MGSRMDRRMCRLNGRWRAANRLRQRGLHRRSLPPRRAAIWRPAMNQSGLAGGIIRREVEHLARGRRCGGRPADLAVRPRLPVHPAVIVRGGGACPTAEEPLAAPAVKLLQ
eukprot:937228-Prorocentrum_minimum.AAC.2